MWWTRNIWTVANAVTAVKLPLAAVFPWAVRDTPLEMGILAVAALSDFLDGRIARRMGQAEGFGMVLDPICDKVFVLTVVATYVARDMLEAWEVAAVALRDVFMLLVGAAVLASGKWRNIPPGARFWGKAVTALQFVLFTLVALDLPHRPLLAVLLVVSLVACYDYTAILLRFGWQAKQGEAEAKR